MHTAMLRPVDEDSADVVEAVEDVSVVLGALLLLLVDGDAVVDVPLDCEVEVETDKSEKAVAELMNTAEVTGLSGRIWNLPTPVVQQSFVWSQQKSAAGPQLVDGDGRVLEDSFCDLGSELRWELQERRCMCHGR